MKKIILAIACTTLLSGAAFAQSATGPAGQQDNTKPGMGNTATQTTGMSKDGMAKGSMSKGDNTMNKGAESKDGDGMPKGGMKK